MVEEERCTHRCDLATGERLDCIRLSNGLSALSWAQGVANSVVLREEAWMRRWRTCATVLFPTFPRLLPGACL